jgi:hypothetical protein
MADTVMSLLLTRAAKGPHANCTLQTCSTKDTPYNYQPSLVANTIFLSLFSFALAVYTVQAICHRKAWAFSIAMICGCIREYFCFCYYDYDYHYPLLLSFSCISLEGSKADGYVVEVLGYIGRVMAHHDPFSQVSSQTGQLLRL